MFQVCLLYHKHNEEYHDVEDISIQCINCHRKTGLHLNDKSVEKNHLICVKFSIASCGFIMYNLFKKAYEILNRKKHHDWFNKVPWYNRIVPAQDFLFDLILWYVAKNLFIS